MKKFISALSLLFVVTVSANAMSYEQARQQALFLTDKMAYELNLNEAQYEAAYEVNLDYLMNIMTPDDLYGVYWTRRNLDLGYILLDWQYRAYCAAAYFYRPLYWDAGYWHFGIYARYPHRSYFYFGRPAFVNVYRGGHSWHNNGDRSWYNGRDFGHKASRNHFGMRDGFDKGNYGRGQNLSFSGSRNANGRNNGSFGNGTRNSNQRNSGSFGNRGGNNSSTSKPNSTFSPRSNNRSMGVNSSTNRSSNGTTFGGGRVGTNRSGSMGNSRGMLNDNSNSSSTVNSSRRNTFGSSRGSSLGTRQNTVTQRSSRSNGTFSRGSSSIGGSRSSAVNRSQSSFSGGNRGASVSRSHSSGSRPSGGGGRASNGGSKSSGGSFGGRR